MIDLYCQVKYIRKVTSRDSKNPNRLIKTDEECYSLHKLERNSDGKLYWWWTNKDSLEPFEDAILLEPDDRAFEDRTFLFKESDLLCE